ncbi:MAG: hypothetical protein FWE88_08665 [Phycisphaerae bacterium]|nr:hypothetical protein [Phycisphaerae bacterium]
MAQELTVSADEREYLRELAKRYVEYAHKPDMAKRVAKWTAHNELRGEPMVVFENWGVMHELTTFRCQNPLARWLESVMLTAVVNEDLVGDDKVITPDIAVDWQVGFKLFDEDTKSHRGTDNKGRQVGFHIDSVVADFPTWLAGLKPSIYGVDRDATLAQHEAVEGLIGDIVSVVRGNNSLKWFASPSSSINFFMGMESMLTEMMDHPDEMKELYRRITDDMLTFMHWQEREGLLTADNGNHYAGAGSYGFSRELKPGQPVRLSEKWLSLFSQETVGISPAMFEEFVYPSYARLAAVAGLTYFGCCEPVHDIWDNAIGKLHGLRKVSVSPWCDETRIGEALRAAKVIYSRKPSPNFVGIGTLDEAAWADHIATTVRAARGGHLEIINRDVYTFEHDKTKPGRAVRIIREQIEKWWK